MSQEQASDLSGIPVANISRYERGESGVPADVLAQLAPVYGHDPGDFFKKDPPPRKVANVDMVFLKMHPDVEDLPEDAVNEILKPVRRAIENASTQIRDLKKRK